METKKDCSNKEQPEEINYSSSVYKKTYVSPELTIYGLTSKIIQFEDGAGDDGICGSIDQGVPCGP